MGSVYKITNEDGREYYGSTKGTLKERFIIHKTPTNSCATNTFNYDTMVIELVEEVEDINDLKVREKFYIQNRACVNKQVPFATRQEKLDQHKARSSKYYYANKAKCYAAAKKTNDRVYPCPCGSVIRFGEKTRHHKSKKHINFMNN